MDWIQQWQSKLNKQNGVAPLVRTGGSRHTGLAALPYRNIHASLIFPSDSSWRNKTMSKYIPGNQKHLTLKDRIYIQNELSKGTSFKDIARFLCKDPTTISKKANAHRLSD